MQWGVRRFASSGLQTSAIDRCACARASLSFRRPSSQGPRVLRTTVALGRCSWARASYPGSGGFNPELPPEPIACNRIDGKADVRTHGDSVATTTTHSPLDCPDGCVCRCPDDWGAAEGDVSHLPRGPCLSHRWGCRTSRLACRGSRLTLCVRRAVRQSPRLPRDGKTCLRIRVEQAGRRAACVVRGVVNVRICIVASSTHKRADHSSSRGLL